MLLDYSIIPLDDIYRFDGKRITIGELKELSLNVDVIKIVKDKIFGWYKLILSDDGEINIYI